MEENDVEMITDEGWRGLEEKKPRPRRGKSRNRWSPAKVYQRLMKLQPRFDKSSNDQHSKHSPHPSDLTQKS